MNPLYPLTRLQIGDAQSYLSQAYIFFARDSHKFLILVDNHSWRMNNNHSKSIHLRELLATKYRRSPFKNTRTLERRASARYKDNSISSNDEREKLYKWVSLVSSRRWKGTALYPLVDLHVALHGFIVFEVCWKDIHGINYHNVLQMDASMAFEVKSMRKWDFDSIHQASSSILSWFSVSESETQALWESLMIIEDNIPSQAPRKTRISFTEFMLKEEDEQKTPTPPENTITEPVNYNDTLLTFYFNNRDLPFTMKEIITTELRLLTLLESGLPSWVIFLQSYPLFCKVYRPWMRPLVRILYILISFVTCMIGFYDLYKNVPLLKATISHICGPLFNWVEDWDMVSRVKYLGTMLFLQNFDKAIQWFLETWRVVKLLFLLLTKPLMEPLQDLLEFISPVWLLVCDVGSDVYDALSLTVFSMCSLLVSLFWPMISPFLLLYSYLISIVAFFKPLVLSIWKLCSIVANHAASFCTEIYELLEVGLMIIMDTATEIISLAKSLYKAKPTTTEVSLWSSLWKDMLSKVFRSLRSILHGLVAFLDSCKRHRLSTSNQLREYSGRMSRLLSSQKEGSPPSLLLAESSHKEISDDHEHVE